MTLCATVYHIKSVRLRGNTIMLDRILAERPDIIFQLAFTLTVSGIFFWQVWVAWKAVTR